jgi:hypothetical protein
VLALLGSLLWIGAVAVAIAVLGHGRFRRGHFLRLRRRAAERPLPANPSGAAR